MKLRPAARAYLLARCDELLAAQEAARQRLVEGHWHVFGPACIECGGVQYRGIGGVLATRLAPLLRLKDRFTFAEAPGPRILGRFSTRDRMRHAEMTQELGRTPRRTTTGGP